MTSSPTLVIGSKNYSSWSLRAWLLLRQFDVAFTEIKLPLDTPEFYARIGDYSPAGRVPVLIDGEVRVWDSLAICEYANECFLDGRAWPADRTTRAWARAISAEMHSGFTALRAALPMNCRKRVATPPLSVEAQRDVERVAAIWREARERHAGEGPFLFGKFSIADAMYAPVVLRFISYAIELDASARAYVETIAALPALCDWLAETVTEPLAVLHERSV
ncbi:glutathione S-transferase family protein [Rudaea sp.]|jgi:glutathione S-transferase|uniref:glutathione S-transferase family protein n=1 Tax=Rudaea sp. TaxID=2136325 RepID=UPI0039C8EB19